MSLFHRPGRRPDPLLEWKVRIFSVAAVLGLGSIYLDERWLGTAAIALLVAAIAMRWLPGARAGDQAEAEPEGPPADAGGARGGGSSEGG